MNLSEIKYKTKKDVEFFLGASGKTTGEMADEIGISRTTLQGLLSENKVSDETVEKVYSAIYESGYRLNTVKEEILKETNTEMVLFHGSKEGLKEVTCTGSRENCDFGKGFYLGESYQQSLSFICENKKPSVYSFLFDKKGLKILEMSIDLEWMLAICYYRGTIKKYENSEKVRSLIKKINEYDVIVAPIADNRMFYIMSSFAEGDINVDIAVHSLSASKLGMQYIFKTEKSIQQLQPIEKYYISNPEKKKAIELLNTRAEEIETKLKLARREFRSGLYIDEVLQ